MSNLKRDYHLERAGEGGCVWDVIVIGGGATGAGIALDASTRGYSVLLVEAHDFGKGTSSRSTKLIHGGVRYLEQFQISMVRESLSERGRLLRNAPHLVHELEFIIPCRSWFNQKFYGAGLKVYDLLAANSNVRASKQIDASTMYGRVPNLGRGLFTGGVTYSDGQFDDTRLLVELVRAAVAAGAVVLNHAPVVGLVKKNDGTIEGVCFQDNETGKTFEAKARCVVNATGPFCDGVLKLDKSDTPPMIAASQGVHLVLPRRYFPSQSAIIVPKTSDGRVLFMIPWHDHVVVGTTDTPIEHISEEPQPFQHELDFLLKTISDHIDEAPSLSDCLSVFTGIRPLVRASATKHTKKLSRDHTIDVAPSGLVTITGGKWTTYRKMAEDCVDHVAKLADLPVAKCITHDLTLQKTPEDEAELKRSPGGQASFDAQLHSQLKITRADLVRGVRYEFARTVEDLLARRTRALFLNAQAAIDMAPEAAMILATELGRDTTWQDDQVRTFTELAKTYIPTKR